MALEWPLVSHKSASNITYSAIAICHMRVPYSTAPNCMQCSAASSTVSYDSYAACPWPAPCICIIQTGALPEFVHKHCSAFSCLSHILYSHCMRCSVASSTVLCAFYYMLPCAALGQRCAFVYFKYNVHDRLYMYMMFTLVWRKEWHPKIRSDNHMPYDQLFQSQRWACFHHETQTLSQQSILWLMLGIIYCNGPSN